MVEEEEEWGGGDPNSRLGVAREGAEVHESNLHEHQVSNILWRKDQELSQGCWVKATNWAQVS